MNIENNILKKFEYISLDDLKKVQLLDRKDTKYVFNQNQLPELLDQLKSSYQILKINDVCEFSYENIYFDTDNFLFYNQHHNQNRNRYKVRFRKYSTTNDCFFEIKIKNNKNRTIKKRLQVNNINNTLNNTEKQLVLKITGQSPNKLSKKIQIQFNRITLSDYDFKERLTIDTNLLVKNDKNSTFLSPLVISEIKQIKYNPKSYYIQILRKLNIPELRFSKYCVGMLHTYKKIKYNRFKPVLLQMNKILEQNKLLIGEN